MENETKQILQSLQGVTPDVFADIIRWGIVGNAIGLAGMLLFITAMYFGVRLLWEKCDEEELNVILTTVGVFFSIVAIAVGFALLTDLLKAWLTPYAYFVGTLT